MDVRSVEDCVIESNSWKLISTGLFPEIPIGFEIQVRSRSGLAAKYGVFVLNSPGTVDSDYRGEIKIILANMGCEIFKISKGDRIAQLVVSPVTKATVISVEPSQTPKEVPAVSEALAESSYFSITPDGTIIRTSLESRSEVSSP
jgi:dUTP pyrophosphatase